MEEQNVRQDNSVCRHHQTGYCKYESQCEKNHYNNICQVQVCRSRACTDRHPRTCKYFANNGDCRYKDKCAYVHACGKEYEKQEMLLKCYVDVVTEHFELHIFLFLFFLIFVVSQMSS